MKKQKRNYKTTTSTEFDYMKVIKIGIGVLLVFGIVYFVTALASGEIKLGHKEEEKREVEIEYQEIIAGEVFNRPASEYYVLFAKGSESFTSYYLSLIESYKYNDNNLPFYYIDLEKKINIDYLSDLAITDATILKISNGSIDSRIVGREDIINFFND